MIHLVHKKEENRHRLSNRMCFLPFSFLVFARDTETQRHTEKSFDLFDFYDLFLFSFSLFPFLFFLLYLLMTT